MAEARVSAFALLAGVDRLAPDARGAFVLEADGGRCVGSLLVEGNRVCWAAAARLRHRLRDLLLSSPAQRLVRSIDAHEVDPAESLHREESLLASAEVAAVVRQHTIESLIALDGARAASSWVPHRRDGYRARFTFGAAQLLAAVGGELYAAQTAGAEQALSQIVPSGSVGASFALDEDGQPVPVGVVAGDRLGLDGLVELGDWANAALGATAGFSSAIMARVAAGVTGPAALGWRTGRRLIHAAVIDDPLALAGVVAEVEQRGHPAVLSARAPRAPRSPSRNA